MHFVMDKGFYSEKGIAPLLEKYIKFAISVPFSTKAAKELAEDCMDGICSSDNAVMAGENIYYAQTYIRKWNNRRVYYDEERHIREKRLLMRKVLHLENQLAQGSVGITDSVAKHYFTFHKTKDGCYNIHRKKDVIDSEKSCLPRLLLGKSLFLRLWKSSFPCPHRYNGRGNLGYKYVLRINSEGEET